MLKINEIYQSVQGESTFAGLPCTFIRLTYCNLRCTYCDTEYAFYEGEDQDFPAILQKVEQYGNSIVEVTGGEPLMQEECRALLTALADSGYTVLLETGGSLPIKEVDPRVRIIMDLKCPSSGMVKKNLYENIAYLKSTDEVKFVVGDNEDIDWAINKIQEYNLDKICPVLFSPVFKQIPAQVIVKRIIDEKIPVRFQLQMHKYIWAPESKGV